MSERTSEPEHPPAESLRRSGAIRILTAVAGLVIVVAGIRAAQPILVPLLISIFIAVLGAAPMDWLRRKGVPAPLAVLLVVIAIMALGAGIATIVGTSVNDFTDALPGYQERLRSEMAEFTSWLQARGIEVSVQPILDSVDPGAAMAMVARVLRGLGTILTNAFLIALTVIFILLEASGFPAKVRAALGDPDAALPHFAAFTGTVKRYLAIKTAVSLATGVVIGIWVWALGIDFPLLWGLVAFLLNYIPNLGSIIAAVPVVLLAFIQYGLVRAIVAAAGYLVVNIVFGNLVEPRFQGRGLGMSTLVIFLSLLFWGWIWGPVGMLLSVPLTMTLKIALEGSPETRWLAILMGREADVQSATPPQAPAAGPAEG